MKTKRTPAEAALVAYEVAMANRAHMDGPKRMSAAEVDKRRDAVRALMGAKQ